ncbi:cation-translocating P-type ATPase [Agathobacter rectalis]|jgi:HAD ATPase, P-type, family IC|uniref:Cation-translocating P-type ATPase n=1 Tax=Agathobacter rectalis TaxID=39491 RepID=A0AAX0BDF3_9FIRM|nr:cation-translocating P-type ATPase [Agathobacter rectalis]MDB8000376.1 cation-translocating P-type ATPase [Agathobacter rectalis]MDB8004998.1 cation-translocating P-type ATPase [Agathobacter rectalis]NSC26832.1 cation-translocating P-type ATPase [Agathobacter rectalis]NSC36867.1 cation-translocating P-type ATPase [Agathobacter rectalis]NSC52581.1 cation-translocating P-type ATPase [Agathobacter rectalis]
MNQMNKDSYSINITGLTDEEVRQRVEEGFTNRTDISTDKTTKEIVVSNVFTYFNLIFLVITILLIMVGSFRNLTFLPIIIGNTVIGIVQEIRAKKTLEKMSLLNAPHADVIRNGSVKQISTEELVKDDVILLTAGKQICADAVVISGNIQVNESLLTGEADEVEKTEGSTLMSGSFVVSGECYARLEKVGNESYISKLSLEAKSMGGKEQSEMIRSINLIVKWVGIVIIPIGLILFWQSHFVNGESITKSVTSTVAAIIGMIPEGLYLLTTVALALSTMKLARKKVLLHDMKSIETLARVDVLCVDKTGTITEPDMKLKEIFLCKNSGADGTQTALTLDELKSLILDYANASVDNNATMLALKAYAADTLTNNTSALHRTAVSQQAFSSSLKYGSVTFSDGTYLLGAPEFIMHEDFARIEEEIIPYADKGDRVLLFARYDGENVENGINGSVTPLGFVALANPIRENAVKTFEYFKSQGVAIKVISGDNPRTVSRIAIQAGIESAESFVDAATLDTEDKIADAVNKYTVFGRVTPKQKKQLVKALQAKGHTVAMTGDGVNDILAMKDADCSVAMASGSEAAAQAAQVVLLDSDFAHMPDVVYEGRRVVNNIQRSASLFLVKNIFSLLLSMFSVILMVTYPLEPAQVSLISMFTIGVPGFLLALEQNKDRIKGHFITNVMLKALPGGLTDVIAVGALVVCGEVFCISDASIGTIATLVLSVVGFMILFKISEPLNGMKYAVIIGNIAGLVFSGFFLKKLFALTDLSNICILLMIVFGFAAESLFRNLTLLVEKLRGSYEKKKGFNV